ncbi:MAG: hypothetical protein J7E09_20685 [Escherichia coli]|nr:hypothetical protein [Escherichia coli]
MKNAKTILLLALSVLLVSGCQAPRGLQHEVSAPQVVVDKQQSESLQNLAKTLADQPMGSVQVVNNTPYGPAQISKDREYVNGLGERCYRFTVTTENVHRYVAVCLSNEKQWRYVELLH